MAFGGFSISPTFESIFFREGGGLSLRVPDYQRAFAWEEKQIGQFIGDLAKYRDQSVDYYFGHYIVEAVEGGWEIVDGQQRITTLVLFLMVCQHFEPLLEHRAFSLIHRFHTVSYDDHALRTMGRGLAPYFDLCRSLSGKLDADDDQIVEALLLEKEHFTRSQRRMAEALWQFCRAFDAGVLEPGAIADYVEVVMRSSCSHHPAATKSVAVNVFEMHNTRGVPLTTVEIVKAKLMKFAYDRGGVGREEIVAGIQAEFGEIFRMEELLAERCFRGRLTLEQILRLHLRVVDDGAKRLAGDFDRPAVTGKADELLGYLDDRLNAPDEDGKTLAGVAYARVLAREFRRSVEIMGDFVPRWDDDDSVVGDVLILDRELSCQFFLLACRDSGSDSRESFGRLDAVVVALWERLLFTRDFHDRYYRLRYGDNFAGLFEDLRGEGADPGRILLKYVKDGFRGWDGTTKDLQGIVADYLAKHRDQVLRNAYHWGGWRWKFVYAIYKFEKSGGANIREILKNGISLDHVLPQEWQWEWVEAGNLDPKVLSDDERNRFENKIHACINGIGNLLLVTPSENASLGNRHPADKRYGNRYGGGSYEKHRRDHAAWRDSGQWDALILGLGEQRFEFLVREMVGIPGGLPADLLDEALATAS
ncbi:DUF262 domain-containing protein [Luteolibacter marinus]|uniref:DUF262 domain-containing protein n=1 Tax=Luteolibacter marinus TaxID=2776705 RepID=UPI001867AA45|nr:DUF262 domain-containing protein [Luteolibacter marinus]